MSFLRLTHAKNAISTGLSCLLSLTLVIPAYGTPDLKPFFKASDAYTTSYLRYTQLKTTAAIDLNFYGQEVVRLENLVQSQSAVVSDLEQLEKSQNIRLQLIPSLIDSESSNIRDLKRHISQTQRTAESSQYFNHGEEATSFLLREKSQTFQNKVDDLQSEIDAIDAKIEDVKSQTEYSTLVLERDRLELRKDNNLRGIKTRSEEIVTLRNQVIEEKISLATWREIQRNKQALRNDLENRQLPPIQRELYDKRNDLDELRRQQSQLLFEKQQIDGEINLKELELSSENRNLDQASLRLSSANARLREADDLINNEKNLRREKRRLEGEERRRDGRRGRDRNDDDKIDTIPEAEELIANRIAARDEAIAERNAAKTKAEDAQKQIDQLNRRLQKIGEDIKQVETQISELNREKDQLKNASAEIEKLRGVISNKNQELNSAQASLENQKNTVSEAQARVAEFTEQIEPLVERLKKLKEKRGLDIIRRGHERNRNENQDSEEKNRAHKQIREIVQQLGLDPTLPKNKRKVVNPQGLIPQRNRAEDDVKNASQAVVDTQKAIAEIETAINSAREQIANLQKAGERMKEVERQLQVAEEQKSNKTNAKNNLEKQRADLRAQRDQASGEQEAAQKRVLQTKKRLERAEALLNRLNQRLAEINRQLDSVARAKDSLPRLRNAVRDAQRDVSTLNRIIEVLNDHIEDLMISSSDLHREIDRQALNITDLNTDVVHLENQEANLLQQLDSVIRELANAVDGESQSIEFIQTAEAQITENETLNREALQENRTINNSLQSIYSDITKFEEKHIDPLLKEKAPVETARNAEQVHVDQLLGWAEALEQAASRIDTAQTVIESLNAEFAELTLTIAQTRKNLSTATTQLRSSEKSLTDTTVSLQQLEKEIQGIETLIAEKEATLDNIVADLKARGPQDAGVIEALEPATNIDEGLNNDFASGDWVSGVVENHKLWKTKACVAHTNVVDDNGIEIARLEVYAEMVDQNQPDKGFSEPTIELVVSDKSMQYLDGSLKTNQMRQSVSMTYATLSQSQNPELQGAMVRLDDREAMISRLRNDGSATVLLHDATGELVEFEFSLKGSFKTIGKAFENCGLKFSDLPEVQ